MLDFPGSSASCNGGAQFWSECSALWLLYVASWPRTLSTQIHTGKCPDACVFRPFTCRIIEATIGYSSNVPFNKGPDHLARYSAHLCIVVYIIFLVFIFLQLRNHDGARALSLVHTRRRSSHRLELVVAFGQASFEEPYQDVRVQRASLLRFGAIMLRG